MSIKTLTRAIALRGSLAVALALSGCWTAPNANVQPKGEPRLIQDGIVVSSTQEPLVVQSVDPGARTVVLRRPGETATSSYKVAPGVSNFYQINAGQNVRAKLREQLAVYILRDGRLGPETIAANARVQWVDPSYRLLTVQYPSGETETFKVGLDVKLKQMQPGSSVVIKPLEAVKLKVK